MQPLTKHSILTVRTAVLTTAAIALAACHDDPAAPPRPGGDTPAPQRVTTPQGGSEPTHLGVAPGGGEDSRLLAAAADGSGTIPGQYIVVFRDDVLNAEGLASDLVARHRGTLRFTYKAVIKGFAAKLSDQAVSMLRQQPNVAYIEQDQVVRPAATQNMDLFGDPWGLDRIDQKWLPLSKTYTYYHLGTGVRAYIFDTGLQANHPQFLTLFGSRAQNVYDAFGGTGADCHGHGTHVGGTVGGKTYGVAKNVLLRGVRVLDCNGFGSWSGIIAALDWVRIYRINPAVANMSLAGGKSLAVNTAVNNLANSGVFVAVAAGNNNQPACNYSPASAAAAFSTAASTKADTKAWFSNHGWCVDGYAPGVGIKSSWIGSGVQWQNGTSMASPHVAGVAALYKHRFGNQPSANIDFWIKAVATPAVIIGNPAGTPNRLLYKSVL